MRDAGKERKEKKKKEKEKGKDSVVQKLLAC